MLMKRYLGIATYILLGVVVSLGLVITIKAQTTSPTLQTLVIELWPEYDRPETLVIYRIDVSPDVALPTSLTFQLPSYIDALHVVASEQNGVLLEVSRENYTLINQANGTLLTLSATSPHIQFEYYDPQIVTLQGNTRQLTYQFQNSYFVNNTVFEIQEPTETTAFTMEPLADNEFIGDDGFRYNSIEQTNLGPTDQVEISAEYTRETDLVSVEALANRDLPSSSEQAVIDAISNDRRPFGYFLIATGVVMFLGTAVYYWWSERQKAPELATQPTSQPSARFCHQCGEQQRSKAIFCHACGAKQRT
ncbi:MAG: zinc ribbon domain-containing protein [Chloroflexota bacterium]